jgi:hypothetical protein
MRSFCRLVPIVLLGACLYSTGCTAGSGVSASTTAPAKAVLSDVPDQDAVEAFTRKAELNFPNYGEGKMPVSDRILDGFEAAPAQLALTDGSSIRWGFKNQEANLQSVVINDRSRQLALLAAVDGVTRLTSRSGSPIGEMANYEKAVKRSGMDPSVTIFVHDKDALKAYLPLLKRWLQADLMGFNADCSKPNLAGACKLAEQIAISTTVYVIAADGNLRSVKVPDGKASSVPLKSFVQ